MRVALFAAALVATCTAFGYAAGGPQSGAPVTDAGGYGPDAGMYGDMCDPCDPCNSGGRHHQGCWARRNSQLGSNCGCNGSYKFPVPPLYTYHWPGMYAAQLMTDYHSPWRFPPLKPYVDEVPPEVLGTTTSLRRVQTASAVAGTARPASRPGSFSEHVEQSLR